MLKMTNSCSWTLAWISLFRCASPIHGQPPQAPSLQQLIDVALAHNPDLARAGEAVKAERERIPQARALPDPTLSLGLQNDGFKKLQIGMMESSYYQVMLTQPLPWPGKRNLREDIAKFGLESTQKAATRSRLGIVAEVKRAYYGLLLTRAQLELLDQQVLLWQKAREITQVRYEVGQGGQADLLRAQLEQSRLQQTRWALVSDEQTLVEVLNRLRGLPPGTPLATAEKISELQPELVPASHWMERAEVESPELQTALIGVKQADRSVDLARRERYPDLAVSAGIMPRGSFEPMWSVGVSISLPVWSRNKQQRSISEQESRRRAQSFAAEHIRNLLRQRIQEREIQQRAALETLRLYREGLLVQSEASFKASLAQYEAGRAPFLSVIEALNGHVADQGGYLQALAQVQALQIAQEEFNLEGTPGISSQSLRSGAMAMGGSPSGTAMSASPAPSTAPEGGSAPAMTM